MAYVFDIWAGLDRDHITVLDSEVVADNSVDPGASIIELLISEDDKNGIAPLLSADEDGVTTEELEVLHGGLREGNDRVVIVSGIGDPVVLWWLAGQERPERARCGQWGHEHQLVGLLLLLENGRRNIILLHQLRLARHALGEADADRVHGHPSPQRQRRRYIAVSKCPGQTRLVERRWGAHTSS